MQDFDEYQKQLIIEAAVAEYHSREVWYTSPETKAILKALRDNRSNLHYQWSLVKTYLGNPDNSNRTFATILKTTMQAAMPPLDLGIKVGNYTEYDMGNFCSETQQKILSQISKIQDFNYRSLELCRLLNNRLDNNPIEDLRKKWQAVITYLRNRNNRDLPLYKTLYSAIENHDINKDYEYYGNVFLQQARATNDPGNKIQSYYHAYGYFNRIKHRSHDLTARIAECEYGVGYFEPAFEHYTQLASKDRRYIPSRNSALDLSLKTGTFQNYITTQPRYSDSAQSFHHFHRAFTKGAQNSAASTLYLLSFIACMGAVLTVSPGLLVCSGLLVAAASAAVVSGGLVGGIIGFFKSQTRNPLDIRRQDDLIARLQAASRFNEYSKQYYLNAIIERYSREKTFLGASEKSLGLLSVLRGKLSVEEKWQRLEYYMLQRKDGFFQNNGKRLFNIVDDVLPPVEQHQQYLVPGQAPAASFS